MKQHFESVNIRTHGAGLYSFGDRAAAFVLGIGLTDGLLTCFVRHTSASLLIQENADPDVLTDLEAFMRHLVSRDPGLYRHSAEGPDDMPSHIRSALMATSLSIPFRKAHLALGAWQGLYLFEHRDSARTREVILHAIGE